MNAAQLRQRYKLDDSVSVKWLPAAAEVKGSDPLDPLLFTARISSSAIDSDREVLLPKGMVTKRFDVSGAGFWNHDYSQPIFAPVGKLQRFDGHIEGKGRFFPRPDDWQGPWMPDYARAFVSAMAKSGRKVGVSVGFVPIETRQPTKKDIESYGEDVRRVVSKWELLEWSIAPVQANADAYVTAVGKSLDRTAYKCLFGSEPKDVCLVPKRKVYFPVIRSNTPSLADEITKHVADTLARARGLLYT